MYVLTNLLSVADRAMGEESQGNEELTCAASVKKMCLFLPAVFKFLTAYIFSGREDICFSKANPPILMMEFYSIK